MSQARSGSVGRYAPSPTGPLHLGNLRTALLAWLQVRLGNGTFILRMEDLDEPRSRSGAAEQILADLRWLGIDWDEGPDCGGGAGPYVQSERKQFYNDALNQLQLQQRVYACICSRKDIQAASSAPHGSDAVIYPGTCRQRLSGAGSMLTEQQGPDARSTAALRLRVDQSSIAFDDQLKAQQHVNLAEQSGDFVIRRRDGLYAYQLAVAVDDALMGVTDVLRGEDLLDSTARQLLLFDILDMPRPRYWHVSLMEDAQGKRMAKRDAATSLASYRSQGQTAAQVLGFLASSIGLIETGSETELTDLLNRIGNVENFRSILREQSTL